MAQHIAQNRIRGEGLRLGPTQVNRAVACTGHRQVGCQCQARLHGADVPRIVRIHPGIAQGVHGDTGVVDGIEQLVGLPAGCIGNTGDELARVQRRCPFGQRVRPFNGKAWRVSAQVWLSGDRNQRSSVLL